MARRHGVIWIRDGRTPNHLRVEGATDSMLRSTWTETAVGRSSEANRANWVTSPVRRHFGERNEPIRLGERKGTKQHGLDHRENGGRSADAEPEREDGDRGEARAFHEKAQRKPDVLEGTHAG
jgi:hypothetical protein